jgi:hypothetical protein
MENEYRGESLADRMMLIYPAAAGMIDIYRQAYDKTGKILHLAKALDLANTLLHVQDPGSGHYPTYLVTNLLDQEGWINCMVYTARTIMDLDEYLNEISPTKELSLPDPGISK